MGRFVPPKPWISGWPLPFSVIGSNLKRTHAPAPVHMTASGPCQRHTAVQVPRRSVLYGGVVEKTRIDDVLDRPNLFFSLRFWCKLRGAEAVLRLS
jgi:hypothetical protein